MVRCIDKCATCLHHKHGRLSNRYYCNAHLLWFYSENSRPPIRDCIRYEVDATKVLLKLAEEASDESGNP